MALASIYRKISISEMKKDKIIFNITKYAVRMRFIREGTQAYLSTGLWRDMFPVAEDRTHGLDFDQRVYDMLTTWRVAVKATRETHNPLFTHFEFVFKTHVKRYISYDHVEVFAHGKSIDKKIKVKAVLEPGDYGENVVIFYRIMDGNETMFTKKPGADDE